MSDAETDTDAGIEVEAVDVDEIVRQERVRAIFDARRECRDKRSKAKAQTYQGRTNVGRALYRDAVEGYVREVQTFLTQTEKGETLWNDFHFGTIDVTPSVEEVPGNTDKKRLDDGTIIAKAPDGREIPVRGLNALFELSPPFTARFEVVTESVGRGRRETSKKLNVEREIPIRILDQMFAAINQYLADIGFDIEVGKSQQHTKLDDDLLEEVEQWRRENV